MNGTDPVYESWHSAIMNSHQRLAKLVDGLDAKTCSAPSYAKNWTIAQVLSHLGSGAEIFALFLRAGTAKTSPPDRGEYPAIWDRWNAKSPVDQVQDSLRSNETFLSDLEALGEKTRNRWSLDLFGRLQNLTGLLQLRLSEHAVHTWDVAAALDPDATVSDDAVTLLLDRLPALAERTGKAPTKPIRIEIVTHSPERKFLLVAEHDGIRLEPDSIGAPARLELPAEAFLRLIYGRLDAKHPPPVGEDGVNLDQLRDVFPGY